MKPAVGRRASFPDEIALARARIDAILTLVGARDTFILFKDITPEFKQPLRHYLSLSYLRCILMQIDKEVLYGNESYEFQNG